MKKCILLLLYVDEEVVKTITTAITTSTANSVMPCFHTVTGEFPITRIKNQAEDTHNGRYTEHGLILVFLSMIIKNLNQERQKHIRFSG